MPVTTERSKKRSGKQRDGDATRQQLIDSALKLFAAEGVDAVSIRAVNADAGLGPASVHYHFGSKEALLTAALLQEGEQVLARIQELATALTEQVEIPSARQLVETLAVPYRELLHRDPVRGAQWLGISGQLSLTNAAPLQETSGDTPKLFTDLLRRCYPGAKKEQAQLTWGLGISTLIILLGKWATAQSQSAAKTNIYIESLIEFVAGGLEHSLTISKAPRRSR